MAKVSYNTKKLANKVSGRFELFVRKIALDGLRQLIRQSPVDTGRFKANWSSGSIKSEKVKAPITPTKKGALTSPSDFGRSSKGISTYKLNKNLWLYNNMVYAVPLEFGSSLQAPKGWMRNTARMMQKKLNEVKDLV